MKVKYISPAVPPSQFKLDKIYDVKVDGKYGYIENVKYPISYLKMLFAPVEGKWDVIAENKNKSRKGKK